MIACRTRLDHHHSAIALLYTGCLQTPIRLLPSPTSHVLYRNIYYLCQVPALVLLDQDSIPGEECTSRTNSDVDLSGGSGGGDCYAGNDMAISTATATANATATTNLDHTAANSMSDVDFFPERRLGGSEGCGADENNDGDAGRGGGSSGGFESGNRGDDEDSGGGGNTSQGGFWYGDGGGVSALETAMGQWGGDLQVDETGLAGDGDGDVDVDDSDTFVGVDVVIDGDRRDRTAVYGKEEEEEEGEDGLVVGMIRENSETFGGRDGCAGGVGGSGGGEAECTRSGQGGEGRVCGDNSASAGDGGIGDGEDDSWTIVDKPIVPEEYSKVSSQSTSGFLHRRRDRQACSYRALYSRGALVYELKIWACL